MDLWVITHAQFGWTCDPLGCLMTLTLLFPYQRSCFGHETFQGILAAVPCSIPKRQVDSLGLPSRVFQRTRSLLIPLPACLPKSAFLASKARFFSFLFSLYDPFRFSSSKSLFPGPRIFWRPAVHPTRSLSKVAFFFGVFQSLAWFSTLFILAICNQEYPN